jgi:hypothetical protein
MLANRPTPSRPNVLTEPVIPKPVTDSINVLETVYHRAGLNEAKAINTVFSRPLTNTEELQPYERNCRVTEEWQLVDTGWLGDQVGMLIIKNREGKYDRIPTEGQKKEDAKRVLEISYDEGATPPWIVLPQESFRGHPSLVDGLKMRSRHGQIRVTIAAFPS